MRFRLLALILALAAVLAVPPVAGAHSHGTELHVRSCQTGGSAWQRYAVFYGRMHAVPGTSRMAMRFSLIDRSSNESAVIPVAPLAHWRTSRAGVSVFGYAQKIKRLRSGGRYAVRVEFRWIDARGHTIKTQRRSSNECRQDGSLANLSVPRIAAQPGATPGTELYLVHVANRGAGTAQKVHLELYVDGAQIDARDIDELKPGERTTVKISGPACSARVRAVLDPLDAIPETNEDDNTLRSRCPVVRG